MPTYEYGVNVFKTTSRFSLPPSCARNKKAERERREEGTKDETHGPDI